MDQEVKRPLINRSLEELVGAVLTIRVDVQSHARDQEPGLYYLYALQKGHYAFEELWKRLPTDDWKWWLDLFHRVGAVKGGV